MNAERIEDWKEDAHEVCVRLDEIAGQAEFYSVGVRSTVWAAAELLREARRALGTVALASAVPPAPATSKSEGHRHVYDESGRCKLAQPGGSGICGALSREAKKAAAAAPAVPPAGGSTS